MKDFPLKQDCFVSSVTLATIRQLGPESLDLDPFILRDIAEKTLGISKMSQKMFDKLNCGYTLIGTDTFTSTIEGFLAQTAIMNNMVFDESEIPYCTLEQCAWSVWEYMNLLGGIENNKPTDTFCPEIITYLQEVGKSNGISTFPIWLSFASTDSIAMPDLTGDVSLFEMYQERQQAYIESLNAFVMQKQEKLAEE